jgi:hypothetical protein
MRARERSYREVVLAVDTAAVVELRTSSPEASGGDLRLWRADGGWRVADARGDYLADIGRVEEFLASLAPLRSRRYIGTMDMLKERYGLGDTAVAQLELLLADGSRMALNVGRATFAPKGVWTYVNVPGEKDILAVAHDLVSPMQRGVDGWRVPYLVHGNPDHWVRMDITIAGLEPFSIVRNAQGWSLDGWQLDSLRISPYLRNMANATPRRYHHGPFDPQQPPVFHMDIHGRRGGAPTRVELRQVNHDWVVTSSQFPTNRFILDPQDELPLLVQPREAFLVGARPAP